MPRSVRCVSHVREAHKTFNASSYRDVYAQPMGQHGPGLWGTQVPPVLLQQTQHLLQVRAIQLMQPFIGLTCVHGVSGESIVTPRWEHPKVI